MSQDEAGLKMEAEETVEVYESSTHGTPAPVASATVVDAQHSRSPGRSPVAVAQPVTATAEPVAVVATAAPHATAVAVPTTTTIVITGSSTGAGTGGGANCCEGGCYRPDWKDPASWGWVAGTIGASFLCLCWFDLILGSPACWIITFLGAVLLVLETWPMCCGGSCAPATVANWQNPLYKGIAHCVTAILGFILAAFLTFFGVTGWTGFVLTMDLFAGILCIIFFLLKRRQTTSSTAELQSANKQSSLASSDGVTVIVDDH